MNLLYYITGNAGLCLLFILVLFRSTRGKENILHTSDGLFLASVSFLLILVKLSFYQAGMLNIDESIMLCGGRTLAFDLRPWISLDPTTSGPLNFLPSIILIKAADWAGYGELRLFYTLAFQLPTIFILFYTLRKVANPYFARIAMIPLVLLFSFFYYADLVHASSENFPMFFEAIVLSVLMLLSFDFQVKRWHLTLAGAACAAAFYVKLQVTPLFLFLTGAGFILLLLVKKRPKDSFIFLSGFVLTHALALGYIGLYGGFQDFIQSYIVGNLRYTTIIAPSQETIKTFVKSSLRAYLPVLASGLLIPTLFRRGFCIGLKRTDLLYHAGFLLTILITLYSIIKPGRYFLHYSLLMIVPLYCYLTWLLVKYHWRPGRYMIPATSLILVSIFYMNARGAAEAVRKEKQRLSDIINQKLVDRLYADRLPEDRMAVWGWGSFYNHAARLIMGTRDVHFDFQTSYTSDLGKYYRKRYLTDLKTNKPKWFLDLSLPGALLTTDSSRLDQYPDINQYVRKNYREVYRTHVEVLYQRHTESAP